MGCEGMRPSHRHLKCVHRHLRHRLLSRPPPKRAAAHWPGRSCCSVIGGRPVRCSSAGVVPLTQMASGAAAASGISLCAGRQVQAAAEEAAAGKRRSDGGLISERESQELARRCASSPARRARQPVLGGWPTICRSKITRRQRGGTLHAAPPSVQRSTLAQVQALKMYVQGPAGPAQ